MSGPKVVVIGAGFAGISAAKSVEKTVKGSQVTLIEARDAAIQKFAGARGSVYGNAPEKFSKYMAVPLDKALKRGKVVHGRVTSVSDKVVTLQDDTTLEFDYLIVATGARNNFGEPPVEATSVEEIRGFYETTSKAIQDAKKILIVGGGPVGIEVAGEICDRYGKEKEVSIVNAGKTLLKANPPFKKSFTGGVLKILEKRGVKVYLDAKAEGLDLSQAPFIAGEQSVKLSTGETVQADLVLLAIGTTLSTSIYPDEWLNEKKQVKVNDYLQLAESSNVFAVGDLNDVPETKLGYFAQKQGPVVAKNIAKIIKKGSSAKLTKYKPTNETMILPVGKKFGKAQFAGLVLGSLIVSNVKGKHVFVKDIFTLYGAKPQK